MSRNLRGLLDLLLRLFLTLGLALSPLAHPLAMASLATQQPESVGACPHHAKSEQPKPGDCCFSNGTSCHCAMTVALPAPILSLAAQPASDHPLSIPRLAASRLPAQEPPPPRP